ncbi:polyribonucleotide nucleotidyltransferase [Neisseria subflava]|uniref:polyribonucleotide nucleotidyltransferase n=1 Tax=Neisseria subflava TaxID=28449 RepID=UPI001C999537|nr:polyribonucleotide nucleotidyltransferase [Neisseria subflava]MBY6286216.1 polyribonucleotide nucleotidyltransferase [Neisseria subflava]
MKTIMDKLANQLNSKEKAIAAVDVVSTILLIVNDGSSQKEAIRTVAVIAREAMDRFEEVGK